MIPVVTQLVKRIPYGMFVSMKLQEVMIGSTNFTSSMSNPFNLSATTMERMIFLALRAELEGSSCIAGSNER